MNGPWTVREFARLGGVTVRALHHYGRLGLLAPARSAAGYRLYTARDLERLEQVVALRFLGLPLTRIREILDRERRALPEVLRAQRRALEEKRRRLDVAIAAIAAAEAAGAGPDRGHRTDTALLRRIIEAIEMQNEDLKAYYTDGAWEKLAERRADWTAADQAAQETATRAWLGLFQDITAALDTDPASPGAQALLDRWNALIRQFTGGDAEIEAGLGRAWADREHWPAAHRRETEAFSDPRVWEFVQKAMRHRNGG